VVFVADDLASWLIGLLANAGRKRLTTLVLGNDQERALRSAASTAVRMTAEDLRSGDDEQAEHVALVISQVFSEPAAAAALAGYETVLEALQAGIAGQLAVLDDASLTGTGQSSADVLGVPGTVVAERLAGHLVRQIRLRAACGGPLFPLAAQLNDDVTHLHGQQIHGELRQLRTAVLEALTLPDTARPAPSPTALSQLPAPAPGFTGRDDELAVLADVLDPEAQPSPVVVSAVAGLAGVGKTTLAVQAAHAAQQRGWYGGVLFIDLRGYDQDQAPVEPAEALDALLRALGVDPEHIPPAAAERAGLYRSVLAQAKDPLLVVADNASSEAQVRSLLPGAGPHRVLVTSRHTLAGLGARLVDVAVLDEEPAIALLDKALRAARPGDDRVSGDRQVAARLARTCGGLPLALQITAALLNADLTLSPAELADDLAAESQRLERLAYDDGSGTGLSVATAFGLSYRRLDEASKRMFRLLCLNPGPDVSTPAAAALAGLPPGQARRVVGGLARWHLVEAAPGHGARWRMHDLVGLYARRLGDEHADTDDRERARDRLLDYYLDTAHAAAHVRPLPEMAVPEQFTGREDALALLDAERASLVAAVSMAANTGRDQAALYLPLLLAEYFSWRRRFDDQIVTTTISLGTARRLGDRANEAAALGNLGIALRETRRFEEAISACWDAAAIYKETGDPHGGAGALNSLGNALREARQFEEAMAVCRGAAAIFRETGDRHGEGMALGNLGAALIQMRRFEEAIAACRDAAGLYKETGDRHGEGGALGNLGVALHQVGQFEEAIAACRDAVAIFRETTDRHAAAEALNNLANALREARRFDEAIAACRDAAAIFRETGDQHSEGIAVGNLGAAQQEVGRIDEAIVACRDAVAIFRETGDQHSEGDALCYLAGALHQVGQFEEAIAVFRDAVAIFRETGDRHGEGIAVGNLGSALWEIHRFDEAATAWQDAAALFRETGDRQREAIALNNLAGARSALSGEQP
jgi:tetratricopeptide (TPR) repeat protein